MQIISVSECFKVHGGVKTRSQTKGEQEGELTTAQLLTVTVPVLVFGFLRTVRSVPVLVAGALAAAAGLAANPFFRGAVVGAGIGGLVVGAFFVYDPSKAIGANIGLRRCYNKVVNATVSD